MTLLERLQSHRGGLLRLRTQLFWYGGRGWDRNPGRVCLILDADSTRTRYSEGAAAVAVEAVDIAALLLIDDRPRWIWVAEADVEVIDESV